MQKRSIILICSCLLLLRNLITFYRVPKGVYPPSHLSGTGYTGIKPWDSPHYLLPEEAFCLDHRTCSVLRDYLVKCLNVFFTLLGWSERLSHVITFLWLLPYKYFANPSCTHKMNKGTGFPPKIMQPNETLPCPEDEQLPSSFSWNRTL